MEVTLQYFEGCPNWSTTDRHLKELVAEGQDVTLHHDLIDGYETAVVKGFCGSPTVLVEGIDPFPDERNPVGLTCRIYETEAGPAGSPTLEQLRMAIAEAGRGDRSEDP